MHSAAQATSAPSGKADKDSREGPDGEKGFIMPPPNPKALVDMIEVMVSLKLDILLKICFSVFFW